MTKPYQFYTREELLNALILQCARRDMDHFIPRLEEAARDLNWNPCQDFDGCTAVEDPLHPFPPCFLHDYSWRVLGDGKQFDLQFYKDCREWGVDQAQARRWFVGIRMAWIFWYKWKKMFVG